MLVGLVLGWWFPVSYKSAWFDHWASDPEFVREARQVAELRISLARMNKAIDDAFRPAVEWMVQVSDRLNGGGSR